MTCFAMSMEKGHPAVWYIALRAAHLIIGSSVVLKAVSIAAAAAAVYVLLFRLKLPFPITSLVVFSGFSLYEYAVVSQLRYQHAGHVSACGRL